MNCSNLFLHHVTLIDAAYIDQNGRPVGISIDPVFTVHGALNGDEQVVEDFGKVKKLIKELIDDRETGFDHKLLVDDTFWSVDSTEGRTTLSTLHLHVGVPDNAVRRVPRLLGSCTGVTNLLYARLEESITQYVNDALQTRGLPFTVSAYVPEPKPVDTTALLAAHGFNPNEACVSRIFRYTHGLPKSTSWGCQNILHGHTSFLVLAGGNHKQTSLAQLIASRLDQSYIYERELATYEDTLLNGTGLEYSTERGQFSLHLGMALSDRAIGLPAAPTIENIVEWVTLEYRRELQEAGVRFVGVSEGLWKGAYRHLI